MRIVGVVPARYKSTRFPGKPLADIHGKPMIWWVYQSAKKVNELQVVCIATDDQRIVTECHKYNMPVIMTSDKHSTGTDRVGEVACEIKADLYVNIQGDEPLIQPEHILRAISPFKQKENIAVTNLMAVIQRHSDLINVSVPKVVTNHDGNAVYFSRLPIPYPKGEQKLKYYKQVCVYAFTTEALNSFCRWKKGPAEKAEDIEMLRFVEHGVNVRMVDVERETIAVDTPADLELVRMALRSRSRGE